MELIAKIRHRVGYVWYWRARHWWLDTAQGAQARRVLLALTLLAVVINSIEAFVAARTPDPLHPRQSVIVAIVILIVALLVGVAVALSANSKPAAPQAQGAKAPTTRDGRGAVRHYGTCWVEDPAQLAWKVVGKDPIKSDGGGK